MSHGNVVERLVAAFNRHSAEDVLALLHQDVELRLPGMQGPVCGHEGYRRLRAELERRLPGAQFTPLGLLETAGTVILPGRLNGSPAPGGRRRTAADVLGSIVVSLRDGLIVRVEAHFESTATEAEGPADRQPAGTENPSEVDRGPAAEAERVPHGAGAPQRPGAAAVGV